MTEKIIYNKKDKDNRLCVSMSRHQSLMRYGAHAKINNSFLMSLL